MARTKKRAGLPPPDCSTLLQLMGFPRKCFDVVADPRNVVPDWSAVASRLESHPGEAAIETCIINRSKHLSGHNKRVYEPRHGDCYPLVYALMNEHTPLTQNVLCAFIQAYPDTATKPKSKVMTVVLQNPTLCEKSDIIDTLLRTNPHLCGKNRTRTFQMMGYPINCNDPAPGNHCRDYNVDWQALERHLKENPDEARILCPIFPLEAALQHLSPPPPTTTVQLLLRLCPEAVTTPDSEALYYACSCNRQLEDPELIRSILRINPGLVSESTYYQGISHRGLPIHEAVRLPCAAQILPDLIQADPNSLGTQIGTYDQSPLEIAVEERNLPTNVLRILLENGHRYGVGGSKGQLFSHAFEDGDNCAMDDILFQGTNVKYSEAWINGENTREWQNLCLALKAAGAFRTGLSAEEMWDYPLLHGLIEFGRVSPESFFLFFSRVFGVSTPEDIMATDRLGRTALIVAIEMAGKVIHEPGFYLNDADEEIMIFSNVIRLLLDDKQGGSSQLAGTPIESRIYTATGTSNDNSTLLPIHLALQLGLGIKHGIEEIINAYVGALAVPNPSSNLIPSLLAAVGGMANLDTVYLLMMKNPHLIATLCKPVV